MDSFELNKIFGAILGTLVFVMGVGFLAEAIYHPIEGRGATYELPMPEGTGEEAAEAAPEVASIAERMQTASAEAGANLINRCQSCHDFSASNEDRTGPGLWGIVERPIAAHDGFAYSDALASLGAAGEVWSYENLDAFIESPRNFAPGTKMTFAGLSNPEDRANLIAFLREQADTPAPLPEAPAAEAPSEAQDEAELADEGASPAETVEVPVEGEGEAAPAEAGESEAAPETGAEETAPVEDGDATLEPVPVEDTVEAQEDGEAAGQ
ncbi:c-type cytochrome [Pelagibacterium xiamenense]|uniref:c-type cytochrome n=1 Tax=Pelagibacterium xiamenense TaxID=2901140 RepID=UPI001E520B58|nr:cytochrome c family protein [Pelagibacterium xiamenense]MCD7058880.1 cytochrome c family protein [Pelagibacterium xiamenense]